MNVNDITQLLQMYMLQSVSMPDDDNSNINNSTMFEILLESMLENQQISGSVPESTVQVQDNKNNVNGNAPGDIMGAIDKVSKKYGVDSNLIKAVVKQESNFHPASVSQAGAEGLMQLMPGTAKSLGVNNPFNVLENLNGGTRYLRNLLNSYNGDKQLALAAYNGGSGRMKKLGVDTDEEIEKMPSETRNYVDKVMKYYNGYNKNV